MSVSRSLTERSAHHGGLSQQVCLIIVNPKSGISSRCREVPFWEITTVRSICLVSRVIGQVISVSGGWHRLIALQRIWVAPSLPLPNFYFPSSLFHPLSPNPFPFNHFEIFLDRDGTYMVTFFLKLSHHSRPKLPRLLRPFGFSPPISELKRLTSFFSASCALFCATGAPQLLWFQMLPHSFYRHGGVYPHLPESRNIK
jgi:hypothetical protein